MASKTSGSDSGHSGLCHRFGRLSYVGTELRRLVWHSCVRAFSLFKFDRNYLPSLFSPTLSYLTFSAAYQKKKPLSLTSVVSRILPQWFEKHSFVSCLPSHVKGNIFHILMTTRRVITKSLVDPYKSTISKLLVKFNAHTKCIILIIIPREPNVIDPLISLIRHPFYNYNNKMSKSWMHRYLRVPTNASICTPAEE